ncbi:MAG: PQQ-binding-like beta-propeller repeat protein [bacterium]|nr:PQQ-binding-like beta-propeller repeat protein [bacterium]
MKRLPNPSAVVVSALRPLVLLFLAAATASAQGTFHGDGARTGVYPEAGAPATGRLKWSFAAGAPIVGSPVVADGVVYFGALDGHLHAVEAATGAGKWKFKSRMPIASTPAIDGDTVYFVSSTGALAALSAATGEPRWVCAVEGERRFEAKGLHGYPPASQTMPDAWDVFTSSPAVSDGLVFFGAGDGGVYAVEAATGVLQWAFRTGNVVHASPAVAGGIVYVGSWDSRVYALEARTGVLKWSFQAGLDPAIHNQEGFQSSCAVAGGVVYVGCRDAHVYALDAATGARLWDYPTGKSWVIGTPAVRDGIVYAGTSDSSRFFALDATTGRLLFNSDTKAYVFSSAALSGPRAYVGCHNGTLYAFDARTGAIDWLFRTEGSRRDPLKLLDADLRLDQAAFHPVTGDFGDMYIDFYRFSTVGAIMASPAIADGVIYFGSLDGQLYAVR